MSQPVCIQLSHRKEAKWYDFHPDDRVSYMIQFIAMENGLDESNYALLVVDKEGAGQWMREDYPLSFYLDASMTYEWRKRHRPVKVIMPDKTYRTQLVDDTLKVEALTAYIGQQFGFSGCAEEQSLDPDRTDVLVKDMTLREQGYYGLLHCGLVRLASGTGHGLYVQLSFMSGKLARKGGKLSGKSKKFYRLKKNKFAVFKDSKCSQELASELVKDIGEVKAGNTTEEEISSKYESMAFTVELPNQKPGVFVASSTKERDEWVNSLLNSKATFKPQKMFFAPVGPQKERVASYRRSDQVDVAAAEEMEMLKAATAAVEEAKRIEMEKHKKNKRMSYSLKSSRSLASSSGPPKRPINRSQREDSGGSKTSNMRRDSFRSFQSVDSSQVRGVIDSKKKKRLSGSFSQEQEEDIGLAIPAQQSASLTEVVIEEPESPKMQEDQSETTPRSRKLKPKIKIKKKTPAAPARSSSSGPPPAGPPPTPAALEAVEDTNDSAVMQCMDEEQVGKTVAGGAMAMEGDRSKTAPRAAAKVGPGGRVSPGKAMRASEGGKRVKRGKVKRKKKVKGKNASVFPVRITVEEFVTVSSTAHYAPLSLCSSTILRVSSTTIYAPMPLCIIYSSELEEDNS